jgi:hypothetical protein
MAEEQPTHPRDEVNDDVRSAIASLKGDAPEPVEAPEEEVEPEAPELEAKADDRPRGPDGKFLPKEAAPEITKDAAPEKAAAPEPKITPPTEDVAKASAPQPSTAAVAPPVSWAADAKAQWASLPPAIQQAVLKRETEASNGFAQYSEKVRSYEQALAPLAQEAQRRGLSVSDGIQRLLDGERFLAAQPEQAILWLAQKNGIDLAQLASNPPAPQQQARTEPSHATVDPRVSQLEERLNTILMDQNMGVVQSFAAANPHYAKVEDQLPAIMSQLKAVEPTLTGQALLQRAYDQAIWLNPDVRAELIAAQQQQSQQQQVQKVAAKAAQASRAAVSIKGSSAGAAPPPKKESTGDVYDDVRAAIAQHRAG